MQLSELPAVSAAEMRRLDDLAIGSYHVSLLQMMENAGRGLARLARNRFPNADVTGMRILVLAGVGGNGGGGMAAARRLHGWGASVSTLVAGDVQELTPAAKQQWLALAAAGVPYLTMDQDHPQVDLILDAMLGYSARSDPRPPIDRHVRIANEAGTPILALDLPTGLQPDSGMPGEPTIRASATVTLALPKSGLVRPQADEFVGQLWLADLGLPPALFRQLDVPLPPGLFASDDLVELQR